MQTPEHKLDVIAADSFLRLVYPAGPWLLTACEPDRKGIETRTFAPDQRRQMHGWLREQHAKGWNLYWSVNPPRAPLDKKASKEDIAAVHFLHVDIDPRAGEDHAAERDRIVKLLTTARPPDVPEPTLVIDSGGGFAGYWRLAEPLPLDGTEAAQMTPRDTTNSWRSRWAATVAATSRGSCASRAA
jgi:hypothetical protein